MISHLGLDLECPKFIPETSCDPKAHKSFACFVVEISSFYVDILLSLTILASYLKSLLTECSNVLNC